MKIQIMEFMVFTSLDKYVNKLNDDVLQKIFDYQEKSAQKIKAHLS